MCVRQLLALSEKDICFSDLFISASINFIFSPKKKEITQKSRCPAMTVRIQKSRCPAMTVTNQKSRCPAMTVTKAEGKKLTLLQKERRLQ